MDHGNNSNNRDQRIQYAQMCMMVKYASISIKNNEAQSNNNHACWKEKGSKFLSRLILSLYLQVEKITRYSM